MPTSPTSATSEIRHGLVWNYASLAVLGLCGIFINLIIASFYGSSILGAFNQVYAIYIMASQFAVGGIHFSALKHIAEHKQRTELQERIFFSSLVPTALLGAAVSLILFLSSNIFTTFLKSEQVGHGIMLVAPALFFFSINKVLLATLNGLQWMRAFAVGQILRSLFLIGYILGISLINLRDRALAGAFLFSECILSIILFLFIQSKFSFRRFSVDRQWIKGHVSFGGRVFLSGVFVELNTRIDVLLLGIFTSDRVVGLYSFAAMLAEGFYQFLVVVRNNVNPILVQLIAMKEFQNLKMLVRKIQIIIYPVMFLIALIVIGLFQPLITFIPHGEEFRDSLPILIVLIAGFWSVAGFVPFDTLLTQAGFPSSQSLLNAVGVGSNLIFNLALIPFWGGVGAAMATASSFVLTIICLNVIVYKKVGLKLYRVH